MRLIAPLFALLASLPLNAAITLPDDEPYFSAEPPGLQLLASAGHRHEAEALAGPLQRVVALYSQEFRWSPDETLRVALLSPRIQEANGYSTVLPFLHTVWYGGGAPMLESFATDDWAGILAAHEVSHDFQMGAKRGPSALWHNVFGATLWAPPVFVYPSALLPRLLLEGDATLNEARFGFGGRLYSGEIRARVLARAKAGRYTPRTLINTGLDFPGASEAYEAGAWFLSRMAADHGMEGVNSFFYDFSSSWLVPLRLGARWRQHFGSNLADDLRGFDKAMRRAAQGQRECPEPALVSARAIGDLNSDGERVWAVAQERHSDPNKLVVVDKADLTVRSTRMDLPLARVYRRPDGAWRAAAAERASVAAYSQGLWGEGWDLEEGTQGRWICDTAGTHTAWADAAEGFGPLELSADGRPLGRAAGRALLDADGRAVYFRQSGTAHVCLRDGVELFRYQGRYGKPVEVGTDGSVWFIGSSAHGCSLYQWDGTAVRRRVDSDVVVDARLLPEGRALVCEVGPDGYALKAAALTATAEGPEEVLPPAGFESSALADLRGDTPAPALDWRPYAALSQTRLTSWAPSVWIGVDGNATWNVYASAYDPLQSLGFGVVSGQGAFHAWQHEAVMQYSRWRLAPFVGGYYVETPAYHWKDSTAELDGWDHEGGALAGFDLALAARRHDSATLSLDTRWGSLDARDAPAALGLSLMHTEQPDLALFPWRQARLWGSAETRAPGPAGAALLQATQDILTETYLTAFAGYAESPGDNIELGNATSRPDACHFPLEATFQETVSGMAVAGVSLAQVVNLGFTPYKMPLGFRRLAPEIGYRAWRLREAEHHRDGLLEETRVGGTVELLMLHNYAVPLAIFGSWSPQLAFRLQLKLDQRF